jgi:hypothetical protein
VSKVYVASLLNVGVDTRDLAPRVSAKTQWKGKHFDPDWDAKERAKIKQLKDAAIQSDKPQATYSLEREEASSHDLFLDRGGVAGFRDKQEGGGTSGKGKWISNEDFVTLQGIRQFKTNVSLQIEEERR